MRKIVYISLIYLACLALAVSCSRQKVAKVSPAVKKYSKVVKKTGPACLDNLIAALGYQHARYTELVMECNILKIQSLDRDIRKIKGQRRLEIVYLNVKCDEISKMLSQYDQDCKKDLTISGL